MSNTNRMEGHMHQYKIPISLIAPLMLTTCGDGEAPSATGEGVAKPETLATEQPAGHATRADPEPTSGKCGEGGTECLDGLECLTWRNGEQACGPKSGPGSVLIGNTTRGGGCLTPNAADPLAGASIASVQMIGLDGKVKGHGRILWEEPGYEVAAERGIPPDGTHAGSFTGVPLPHTEKELPNIPLEDGRFPVRLWSR